MFLYVAHIILLNPRRERENNIMDWPQTHTTLYIVYTITRALFKRDLHSAE